MFDIHRHTKTVSSKCSSDINSSYPYFIKNYTLTLPEILFDIGIPYEYKEPHPLIETERLHLQYFCSWLNSALSKHQISELHQTKHVISTSPSHHFWAHRYHDIPLHSF